MKANAGVVETKRATSLAKFGGVHRTEQEKVEKQKKKKLNGEKGKEARHARTKNKIK
jgi:hypothetical protein